MPDRNTLETMAIKARKALTDPDRSQVIRAVEGEKPRFELFHGPVSLCSQKVRLVLAEKGLAYRSNAMITGGKFIPAENYHPDFVRLRLVGGVRFGHNFVSHYSGISSVGEDGFDPCVVPVLIDYEREEVVIDSLKIVEYIDAQVPTDTPLIPEGALHEPVKLQLKIIDELPHPALLYGFHPDRDDRPEELKAKMHAVYDNMLKGLHMMLEENADDPILVAAYRAKIGKQQGGLDVNFDPDFQRSVRDVTKARLDDLAEGLDKSDGEYLFGDRMTLADLEWGMCLVRLQYLGLSFMWEDHPQVRHFFARMVRRPSIRTECVEATITHYPHSPHMADILVS